MMGAGGAGAAAVAEVGFRLGRVWGLRDDCHLVNAVGARWWEAEVKLS